MDEHAHLLSAPNQIFKNSFVQISIYTPESVLLVKWEQQITLKQRKKGFLKALKFIKKYEIKNWLMNNENILFVTQEEKDWILTEWIGLLSQTSLEKAAIVYPDNYELTQF